jgi:hypothetical protein
MGAGKLDDAKDADENDRQGDDGEQGCDRADAFMMVLPVAPDCIPGFHGAEDEGSTGNPEINMPAY